MKQVYLLACCLLLNANAMYNAQQHSPNEVERNFAYFDVRCPEARESIFTEDPADVARRLIRPSRPAYGGYGHPEDPEKEWDSTPRQFQPIEPDYIDEDGAPVCRVKFLKF